MRRQFVLTPMGLQPADNTHVSTRVAQSSGALTSHAEAEQGPASNEDTSFLSLREIAREVHELGAKHLASRHGAASFESSRLLKIGIKLPKKQRIGAKHGVPSLNKTKKRELQKKQELIDSGMLAVRGRSKSKARKAKEGKGKKDRGLNEAKGFRAGLLKVDSTSLKGKGKKKLIKGKNPFNRRR